jgi:hypothetical protein
VILSFPSEGTDQVAGDRRYCSGIIL